MKNLKLFAVGGLLVIVLGLLAGPAFAAGSGGAQPPGQKPHVLGNATVKGGGSNVLGVTHGSSSGSTGTIGSTGATLPFTGAELALYIVIGVSAIGVGTYVVRRTRRQVA